MSASRVFARLVGECLLYPAGSRSPSSAWWR